MIGRRGSRALVAAFLGLFVVGASACGNTPTAPSSKVVVAFGDSITAGVRTTGGNDYVSLLSDRTNVSIINAGRSGDTTGSALARIDAAVLSRDAHVVIVLLGGNDILASVPVQQRIANITAIATRIRQDGADVILVGLGRGPLDPFDGQLPAIAGQTSSTLVPDILEGIFGVPDLMADPIHPNNAGHRIIANRIEPALRALLTGDP